MGVMNKLMNMFGLMEEEELIERESVIEEEEDLETNKFGKRKSKGNVVPIHSQKNTRIVLAEPRSYEETQEIADHLCQRRSIVVNLQRVRADQAIRIVDFLSGTVYALNGNISKVGNGIFLCTPDLVEIHGSITEILNEHADK